MHLVFSPALQQTLNQIWLEQLARLNNPAIRSHKAVYVAGSMDACYYLTLNGQVLREDDEQPLAVATEPFYIYGTLIIAAQRFDLPELLTLVPARPADGVVCHHCAGTSYLRQDRLLCPTCEAKGWIAATATASADSP
jgi:hypothetical protein